MDWEKTHRRLVTWLAENGPIAVAFSGGVDSALLAKGAVTAVAERNAAVGAKKAAMKGAGDTAGDAADTAEVETGGITVPQTVGATDGQAVGADPVAFFAVGPTSSAEDVAVARRTAREIGIRLVEIRGDEMTNPDFLRNEPDRCYHCKRIRFSAMREAARREGERLGVTFLLTDGENADDLSAYRPGHRAAAELGIRSPLAELGIDKKMIRRLAAQEKLSVADRPSTPCLVTRIAYGTAPTESLLRRIEAAESYLKEENFPVCRVRTDADETARIEVPAEEISRLTEEPLRRRVVRRLTELGFPLITVDLEGFASGKMDRVRRPSVTPLPPKRP